MFLEDVFEDVAKHPSNGEATNMAQVCFIYICNIRSYLLKICIFFMLLHQWLESVSMAASPKQSHHHALIPHTHIISDPSRKRQEKIGGAIFI